MTIKLESGKQYVTRSGQTTRPLEYDGVLYKARIGEDIRRHFWKSNGTRYCVCGPGMDLVAEHGVNHAYPVDTHEV